MTVTLRTPATDRHSEKADPRLFLGGSYDEQINRRLAAELPAQVRDGVYFDRNTMPAHWLGAIAENHPTYQANGQSIDLNFRPLPEPMRVEFLWATERQVQLGLHVHAGPTSRICFYLAKAIEHEFPTAASLFDRSKDEWLRTFRKMRMINGQPLKPSYIARLGWALTRNFDTLAHVYHKGPWWELDVWNPTFDPRIPLREHEPHRHSTGYFEHLTTPWLRQAAKYWLSQQLERDVYTWSTVLNRRYDLTWFQRYSDMVGCDGPHLTDDPAKLGPWIKDFRQWLRQQKCRTGPNKGRPIGETRRRGALTALEQLYRFMFTEGAAAIGDRGWARLGPQHAVLFSFGEKPTGPKHPRPELILSDAVITRIAQHSELIARPVDEGGIGDEQLLRILGLMIRTGRRVREITMLDYDPLIAIPFPDPNGHVARLRYQQTKISTGDGTILVDQEVVDLIRQQQAYARAFMARQGKPDLEPKYLFLAHVQNRNGERPYCIETGWPRLTQFAKLIDLRDEVGREVELARTHALRHTKATNLLNAGVPIHVAMRYMGHASPTMFMHYAQTLAETAEREFLRYKKITADGRDHPQDPQELFESIALDKRTDRVLPNGWCLLPPRHSCDKGNACLSCTKFATDASHEPTLRQQHRETLELIDRRQHSHSERFGAPMSGDNIWLTGRQSEVIALDTILKRIEQTRSAEAADTTIRGAGAPQRRETEGDSHG